MKIPEALSVSSEYIRAQLIIAQSHHDDDARTRARNLLLAIAMPRLLKLCRRMRPHRGPSENELMSEAVSTAIQCIKSIDTKRAEHFLAYICTRARYRLMDLLAESKDSRPLPLRVVRRLRTLSVSEPAEQGCAQNYNARPQLGRRALKTLAPLMPQKPDEMESPVIPCDNLPDSDASSPAELCERSERTRNIADLVSEALSRLSERQREVVMATYSAHGDQTKPQSQIAAELGISYQRVQRILKSSLRHMRSEIAKQKRAQESCLFSA